jgi:hypothetical protein
MSVFYYCRTYYKAVRVGGGRIVEDMYSPRRNACSAVPPPLSVPIVKDLIEIITLVQMSPLCKKDSA